MKKEKRTPARVDKQQRAKETHYRESVTTKHKNEVMKHKTEMKRLQICYTFLHSTCEGHAVGEGEIGNTV